MPKRSIIAVASLVVATSLLGLTTVLLQEGLGHPIPAQAWRDAQMKWNSGRTGEAVQEFIDAFGMTLDNGARHTIARPLIDQMRTLRAEGRINEAYDRCMKALEILDIWDQGGMLTYDCSSLEIQVRCTVVGDEVVCPP